MQVGPGGHHGAVPHHGTLTWAAILGSIASATLTIGCSGPAASTKRSATAPSSSTAGPSGPRCGPGLLILAGDWNGAAGSTFGYVTFSNAGRSACVLTGGYPTVKFLNDGRLIATAARASDTGAHPAAFLLTSGTAVGALIQLVDTANLPSPSCAPTGATQLMVTAPSGAGSVSVDGTFEVCTGVSSASVGPVQNLAGLTGF